MAKWRIEYAGAEKNRERVKIHCFTCRADVPTHWQAGRYHRGHECEYVPDPVKN